MAIRVTRQLRGQQKEILCYVFGQGTFWRDLETEKALGLKDARRFLTSHGASQAASIEGGAAEVIPDVELSGLLMRQAS